MARLGARVDEFGDLVPLFDQERSLWDVQMLRQGRELLERSAFGENLSEYHLEAMIAAVHSSAPSLEETDWESIVSLYDKLLAITGSPVVALNRAIALGQWQGPEAGLLEISRIPRLEALRKYPFYWAAVGQMEEKRGRPDLAKPAFQRAESLARNPMEKRFFTLRAAGVGERVSERERV